MNTLHAVLQRLHNPDLGMLFIRLALGAAFIHAGWLKLMNMDMTVGFFGILGIPVWLAYVVAYSEFLGGIAMVLGIFTRYAGIVLAAIMIVATLVVHLPKGFGLQGGGYEYTLVLLLAALSAVTLGSGKYSLAQLIKR